MTRFIEDPFADPRNHGEERAGESAADRHGLSKGTPERQRDERLWRSFVAEHDDANRVTEAPPLAQLFEGGVGSIEVPKRFKVILGPAFDWGRFDRFLTRALRAAFPDAAPTLYFSEQWKAPVAEWGWGWHVDQRIYDTASDMGGIPAYFPARGCHIRTALPWPIDQHPPLAAIPWGGPHAGRVVFVPKGYVAVILAERTKHTAVPSDSSVPRTLYQTRHSIYGNPPNRR